MSKPILAKGLDYIEYLFKCRTRYDIHSPFLFKFIEEVLRDQEVYPEFKFIDKLRKRLLRSGKAFKKEDYGAGEGFKKDRLLRDEAKISGIPPKYGKLLFRIVRYFNPTSILELGTSLGLGTSYLAAGAPHCSVYSVEGCPETYEIAGKNFEWLNLQGLKMKNIRLLNGNFDEVLPQVIERMGTPDLVFFDGNHRLIPTLKYMRLCLEKSHANTVFIFDDIHWSLEMEEAWEEIKKHPSVTLTIDIYRFGIVFLNPALSKEDFILKF